MTFKTIIAVIFVICFGMLLCGAQECTVANNRTFKKAYVKAAADVEAAETAVAKAKKGTPLLIAKKRLERAKARLAGLACEYAKKPTVKAAVVKAGAVKVPMAPIKKK